METLAANQDLSDPKAKDGIARQVLPLIREVPNPLERDDYIQRLARLLKVDERTLMASLTALRAKPTRRRAPVGKTTAPSEDTKVRVYKGSNPLEQYILAILLRDPHFLYLIDRHLLENQLGRLSIHDFHSAEYQTLFRLIQQSIDQDSDYPLHYVMDNLSLEIIEATDELLEKTPKVNANQQKLLEDVLRAIIQLRQQTLVQTIEYQRFQMMDEQNQEDIQTSQYQKIMVQLTQELLKLNLALKKYTSH
ncbi:MAG: hypothetical protein ACPL4H_08440 [Anaerolineales bacterium]